MPTERFVRRVLLVLFAPAGMIAGHALVYASLFPDPDQRAAFLAETGHGWWPAAVPVAALLALAGAVMVGVWHLRDGRPGVLGADSYGWLAPRLAVWQLNLYLVVECVERLVVHHGLHDLVRHALVSRGAAAQVSVAVVMSALLWWLALTAERLRTGSATPWRVPDARPPRPLRTQAVPGSPCPAGPLGARAPPASAVLA